MVTRLVWRVQSKCELPKCVPVSTAASPLKVLFEIHRPRNPTCLMGDLGMAEKRTKVEKEQRQADSLDKKTEGLICQSRSKLGSSNTLSSALHQGVLRWKGGRKKFPNFLLSVPATGPISRKTPPPRLKLILFSWQILYRSL